jgi:hypothetical protein
MCFNVFLYGKTHVSYIFLIKKTLHLGNPFKPKIITNLNQNYLKYVENKFLLHFYLIWTLTDWIGMQDAGVEYWVTKEFVYNIMMEGLPHLNS